MKTFEEFVLDWWHDYLQGADDNTLRLLMEGFIGDEETIDDYIPEEAATVLEWLQNVDDAEDIWERYFGFSGTGVYDNMPDSEEMTYQMLIQAAGWWNGDDGMPDFAEDFVRDMACRCDGYDQPLGFFNDLSRGGCQSGMVGMLIYNSDCKRIYIDHIDDMEDYVEQIEEECGIIKNENHIPHYTLVCWVCYEELAYQIARTLYSEDF